jgi:hypothetical protein
MTMYKELDDTEGLHAYIAARTPQWLTPCAARDSLPLLDVPVILHRVLGT